MGLVDELGGLDKALEIAAEKAGVEEYSIISYPAQASIFSSLMGSAKKDYIEGKMNETLGEYYQYLKVLDNRKEADRIQARIPFDLRIN